MLEMLCGVRQSARATLPHGFIGVRPSLVSRMLACGRCDYCHPMGQSMQMFVIAWFVALWSGLFCAPCADIDRVPHDRLAGLAGRLANAVACCDCCSVGAALSKTGVGQPACPWQGQPGCIVRMHCQSRVSEAGFGLCLLPSLPHLAASCCHIWHVR
jgi:hypothetical protein